MVTKTYKVSVSGKDAAECEEKMKAVAELLPVLSGKEWKNMSHIVKHDPATMSIVKPILNR